MLNCDIPTSNILGFMDHTEKSDSFAKRLEQFRIEANGGAHDPIN
jgi:hypothetical protein